MFKAAEVERKIREINLLIDMQIKLSLYRTSDHYISSLQQLSWDSLGTKNVSLRMRKSFGSQQIMAAEKTQQKIHRVYPPEIIQTSSPGRLQKRPLEHNDCLLICSVRIARESQDSPNGQYLQFPQLLSNKLSNCYSNAFKKHQNDTGTICLKIILRTWDMFCPMGQLSFICSS